MSEQDPKLIISPRSCQYTEDGITIDVQIYKLEGGEGWTLELVDEENNSTVWEELFTTDESAWQEFEAGVKEIGLVALLQADEGDEATVH
jgi:hypothetical protein